MSNTPGMVVPRPHQHQAAPPGFIYTAIGKLVPICKPTGEVPVVQKLLIVLPFYDDDRDIAQDLAGLICDLERVRVKEADIMVMQRHDAHPFDTSVLERLGEKFEKVHVHTCRRKDGIGHPFGANQMFFDIVTLMAQVRTWSDQYYGFLWLEPDATPTRPGWINEIVAAYNDAHIHRGKFAIGFIHSNPSLHLNGVAVYASDLWRKIPGDRLGGGNAQAAFDVEKGPVIVPMAENSPLFYFEYRKATVNAIELFAPRNGVVPAIFHGVKDASARQAVRARFLTFTDKSTGPRPNVFTFYQPVNPGQDPENQSILRHWVQAWKGRGFNPVILKGLDAGKNAHYVAFSNKIGTLPTTLEKQTQLNRFLRWLALDTAGGGLLVEYDVLPGKILPEQIIGLKGFHLARPREVFNLAAALADKPALGKWLDRIQAYEAQPEDMIENRRSVSDINVMRRCAAEDGVIAEDWITNFGDPNWQNGLMIHFNSVAIVHSTARGQPKSQLMEKFLRGDSDWLMPKTEEAAPALAPIRIDAPVDEEPAQQGGDPELAKELYQENEALRAENEKLKADQASLAQRLAALEARPEPNRKEEEQPLQQAESVVPKKKPGRPKKVVLA